MRSIYAQVFGSRIAKCESARPFGDTLMCLPCSEAEPVKKTGWRIAQSPILSEILSKSFIAIFVVVYDGFAR